MRNMITLSVPSARVATDSSPANSEAPASGLSALAAAVFLTGLTLTLPAGILPEMGDGLGTGESAAGQTVTAYAIGAALTAIPLAPMTARWRRKPLLMLAVAGFAVAGAITAVSPNHPMALGARLAAGAAAGLVWALLAGYTARPGGRSVTIAMAGAPVALALGLPAGALLGEAVGWRITFATTAALGLALLAWITLTVPDFPERAGTARPPTLTAVRVAGVAATLFTALVLVWTHATLDAHVASALDRVGAGGASDVALLALGAAVLFGLWAAVRWINRRLRALPVAAVLAVTAVAAALALLADDPASVYLAVVLAALGWGGRPLLRQAADGTALATLWGTVLATTGVFAGVLLGLSTVGPLAWAFLVLLVAALAVPLTARAHGFAGGPRVGGGS
ncbi:MFS transporter [Phytomonospora sp. NPDC050363]|uniref:MFS transporter n=1 Tax=Phytomonospora sp. NPDC050363 TaxID=3155642 RepID=UPI0033E48C3C